MIDPAAAIDFVSIQHLLKATPAQEGDERMIYIEASNEGVDQQGEVVLSEALANSAEYFKRYGNIDIDHYTILGPKAGIQNPLQYEIGRPVDVRIEDRRTFVKAQLYRGDSDLARNANMVWDSMTTLSPPARWYPSVGGSVIERAEQFDPESRGKVTAIKAVRWTNIGLSKTPVNQHVPTATASPMGVFAKSMNCFVLKALEAGTATDSASITGGQALGRQSLDRGIHSYFDFRERISAAIRNKQVGRDITNYAMRAYGLDADKASEWAEKYAQDLTKSLAYRRRLNRR